MKVFVTGGTGFIGSVVVRRLCQSGHSVVCLLRPTSATGRIEDLPFERRIGDVRDVASVRAGIHGTDCTVHLAAPDGWSDDPSALIDIIEGGTRNILSAAGELPNHRVVFVSSTAAINGSDSPIVFDERAEYTLRDPQLVYANAKHNAEGLARAAFEQGISVVTVNPAETYGPGDIALGTARNLIDFAKSTPVLVCDGGTSVVHVNDVAAGILAALERGRAGERYILGGENMSVRSLATLVLELVDRRARTVRVPNVVARVAARAALRFGIRVPFDPQVIPYATRYWLMDSTKARNELGVTFRDARATIGPTLDWLFAAGHL